MKIIELKFLICHAALYSSQGIVYNMLPKEEAILKQQRHLFG